MPWENMSNRMTAPETNKKIWISLVLILFVFSFSFLLLRMFRSLNIIQCLLLLGNPRPGGLLQLPKGKIQPKDMHHKHQHTDKTIHSLNQAFVH